jgi:polysaccharide export outer membrane protein
MKFLFSTVLFVGLLSTSIGVVAQQSATKPVPSATPASRPVQTTTSGPSASVPANVPASYIVGPDDSIQVLVWKEPNFSGVFPVRPDGMITIPLVGDIMASGRTPMDLAKEVTEKLKSYVNDPTVNVTVMAVNSKRVFLMGEVAHIGPIALTSDLTPLQAIATAGGLTPYANKSHIYILRGEPGKQKKIPFDYKKAIKDGNQQGVILLPGDTIVVP